LSNNAIPSIQVFNNSVKQLEPPEKATYKRARPFSASIKSLGSKKQLEGNLSKFNSKAQTYAVIPALA